MVSLLRPFVHIYSFLFDYHCVAPLESDDTAEVDDDVEEDNDNEEEEEAADNEGNNIGDDTKQDNTMDDGHQQAANITASDSQPSFVKMMKPQYRDDVDIIIKVIVHERTQEIAGFRES